MILASIDVGIKNCSICIFDISSKEKFKIIYWNNISFVKDQPIEKCGGTLKNGKTCGKKSSMHFKDEYFCSIHAKTSKYKLPETTLNNKNIKKKKIDELKELCKSKSILFSEKVKKKELIDLINEYIDLHYLKKNITEKIQLFNLVDIGRNLVFEFNAILNEIKTTIDVVIIENQIGPLAIKMKTLQGMITQYFIMQIPNIEIEWVSSINKLKEFNSDSNKLSYKDRKAKSIEICQQYLKNNTLQLNFFIKNKKKDDLADSFLQGLWYIQNKIYKSS